MLFAKDESLEENGSPFRRRGGACSLCKLMLQKPNVLVFDEPPTTWIWNRSTP